MSNKPIYVLHVYGFFNHGGAEAMGMNLYKNIDRNKVQFGFVVHGEKVGAFEDKVKKMGAEIFRVPKYKGVNHFEYIKAWNDIFKKNPKYTIIHSHVRSTASLYLKIAKKYDLKTIAHSHSTSSGTGVVGKIKDVFQRDIVRDTDQFLACSLQAGEWLFGEKVVKQPNFHVLNNAIDTTDFQFSPIIREQKRKELGFEDKLIIGHVGRFHEVKNHDFIIDIFEQLVSINSEVELVLVGDGELKRQIQKKVKQLSLNKKVHFLGFRDDVDELLQAMDLFLMPSFKEGLPVTLVETQASSLPAVISDTITDEIKLSEYVIFESLNSTPKEWAESILNTLNELDRKDTSDLIKAAKYDIEVTSEWYTEFIKELSV